MGAMMTFYEVIICGEKEKRPALRPYGRQGRLSGERIDADGKIGYLAVFFIRYADKFFDLPALPPGDRF